MPGEILEVELTLPDDICLFTAEANPGAWGAAGELQRLYPNLSFTSIVPPNIDEQIKQVAPAAQAVAAWAARHPARPCPRPPPARSPAASPAARSLARTPHHPPPLTPHGPPPRTPQRPPPLTPHHPPPRTPHHPPPLTRFCPWAPPRRQVLRNETMTNSPRARRSMTRRKASGRNLLAAVAGVINPLNGGTGRPSSPRKGSGEGSRSRSRDMRR